MKRYGNCFWDFPCGSQIESVNAKSEHCIQYDINAREWKKFTICGIAIITWRTECMCNYVNVIPNRSSENEITRIMICQHGIIAMVCVCVCVYGTKTAELPIVFLVLTWRFSHAIIFSRNRNNFYHTTPCFGFFNIFYFVFVKFDFQLVSHHIHKQLGFVCSTFSHYCVSIHHIYVWWNYQARNSIMQMVWILLSIFFPAISSNNLCVVLCYAIFIQTPF